MSLVDQTRNVRLTEGSLCQMKNYGARPGRQKCPLDRGIPLSNGEFWRQAWDARNVRLTEGSLCQTENSGARTGIGDPRFDRRFPLSNSQSVARPGIWRLAYRALLSGESVIVRLPRQGQPDAHPST